MFLRAFLAAKVVKPSAKCEIANKLSEDSGFLASTDAIMAVTVKVSAFGLRSLMASRTPERNRSMDMRSTIAERSMVVEA